MTNYAIQLATLKKCLNERGVNYLYHVNSVTTSCSFLKEGGLCSRSYLENKREPQTKQKSDDADKYNGVWNMIFLNFIDIHSQSKHICFYGPVSFKISIDILSKSSKIYITRSNPMGWKKETGWEIFNTSNFELFSKTCFNNMLMVATPNGKLEFGDNLIELCDDNPRDDDLYHRAIQKLHKYSSVPTIMRNCTSSCGCDSFYKNKDNYYLKKMF